MPSVPEYVERIRTAVYGEEVRGSIADAIEAINDDAVGAAAVANAAAQNAIGNFAPEFSSSNTYKAGDYVNYTDGKIYRIDADQAAGTTWANTSKTEVTSGEEIADIKEDLRSQTTIFDINRQETGIYVNKDGEFVTQGANIYRLSDYIPIVPGQAYKVNCGTTYFINRCGAFYDSNKTIIEYGQGTNTYKATCLSGTSRNDGDAYIFVAPKNAAYVKICYRDTNELEQIVSSISPLDVITPEMFGAVGDGVTDDTRPLQNMLNTLNGDTPPSGQEAFHFGEMKSRTVLCSGSYVIAEPLIVLSGLINFIGLDDRPYHSTFIHKSYPDTQRAFIMFTIRNTGVCFDSISFSGPNYSGYATQGNGVALLYDLNVESVSLNGNIDGHVRKCEFSSLGGGIRVKGQNLRIDNCLFSQCAVGISYENMDSGHECEYKGFVVQNCRFHQLRIGIQNLAKLTTSMFNRSTLITGNLADIVSRFYHGYGHNLVMTGNEISYCINGDEALVYILKSLYDSSPIVDYWNGPFLISGNTFDAKASGAPNTSASHCIVAEAPGLISNNVFKDSKSYSVYVKPVEENGQIVDPGANGTKISNNFFNRVSVIDHDPAIYLEGEGNVYFVNDNLTGNTNGNDGIGGDAYSTSHCWNNYVGVI